MRFFSSARIFASIAASGSCQLPPAARAVAYMAPAAGGRWQDPDAAMPANIRAEEKKRIAQTQAKK